ncbi:MAG: capsule biosynthesis protein [Pseudomonadota bacterium]
MSSDPSPEAPEQGPGAARRARRAQRRKRLQEDAEAARIESEAESDAPGTERLDSPGQRKRRDLMQAIRKEDQSLPATTKGTAVDQPADAIYPMTDEERDAQIAQIQRDLVKRRRRRWFLLWLRLAFFVVLPTTLVGIYYYNHASPLYSTNSAFVIDRAAAPGAMSAGGLLSGTTFATSREAISVQEFLTSREAMRALDEELQIIEHYSDPTIDPIQRLEPDASENAAYRAYKDRVLVGYDTTEGIVRLEVIAASPDMALAMSERLISMAEARVDTMSDANQNDAVRAAQQSFDDSTRALDEAYDTVLALQEQVGVFSAEIEVGLVQTTISALTASLEERRLSLAALLDNARPNPAQLRILNAEIARLETAIDEQRAIIVNSQADQDSLARVSADLNRAEQRLALQQVLLQEATASLVVAQREAAQQSLYLSLAVNPILQPVPTYPRKLEYTALAFVIFFAIYMVASLTISILREQMSYGN